MSNILNIGKTALNAAQIGIATTGHNIANAATPGFNRQVIVQSAAQAQNFGYGFVGQGTDITGVERVYNSTLAKQMLNNTANSAGSSAYLAQINEINTLLSDPAAGLNPVMTQFFSSVNAVTANPSDPATRQTLISSANAMVSRFGSIDNRLDEIRSSINTQITGAVSTINSYAKQISELNTVIDRATSSTGNPPNDLMDQRDLLVSELSKQIKTSVIPQSDGRYNVFIGNGTPLVVGNETYELFARGSYTDPERLEIAYGDPDNPKIMSSISLQGGTLGGILQFRSETLDVVQNQVGQLATTLATQFNTQHRAGFDLSGTAGVNFFNVGAPMTVSNSNNTDPSKLATATITNPSVLTSSDYTLRYTGGQYNIVRNSDKTMTANVTLPVTIDGVQIDVNSATPAEGDEYLIQPTRFAAGKLSLAFEDVNKLAFAGSGTTGERDNRNGLLLAALQNGPNVNLSSGSVNRNYAQAFAMVVSGVGTKTNEMTIISKADATALENANSAMQSESGVNLDEEAANLLRYQQAYQAAGKMMQIASQMFELLLQMGA